MAASKEFKLVSFRMDLSTWQQFLTICRSKDTSASAVLRNYIDLITSNKYEILDPPSIQFRPSTQKDESDP